MCDPHGSNFCAMLQGMQPTLCRLRLDVQDTMTAPELATVLQTLCQQAPHLDGLVLFGLDGTGTGMGAGHMDDDDGILVDLFPGFKPLQALLVGREDSATLRILYIQNMGPVGRAQILELASMATANSQLSLRKLSLQDDCPCSEDGSWAECRKRAEDALRAAAPSLENYFNSCTCDSEEEHENESGSGSEIEGEIENGSGGEKEGGDDEDEV